VWRGHKGIIPIMAGMVRPEQVPDGSAAIGSDLDAKLGRNARRPRYYRQLLATQVLRFGRLKFALIPGRNSAAERRGERIRRTLITQYAPPVSRRIR
jgi:hypothetical protein